MVGIITYFELANLAASSFGEVKVVFSDNYWTLGWRKMTELAVNIVM